MLSRSSLRLRRVAMRFLANRTFATAAAVASVDSSPAFMTTRLSPSAYHATVGSTQQAPAQRFDLESSVVGVEALPKFSALCARCGFEPSFNCRQCDDPLMTGMPLNDEPWFPNGGSGTTFVQ